MKDLSKCEQMVMEEIWSAGKIDLTTAMERVNKQGKEWKYQTVGTFLRRLVEKGYAKREKRGRHTCYSPIAEKEEYAAKLKKEYEDFCEAVGVEGGKI